MRLPPVDEKLMIDSAVSINVLALLAERKLMAWPTPDTGEKRGAIRSPVCEEGQDRDAS